MEAEDFPVMDVGDTFCINVRGGWEGMDLFAIMVNVYNNCVVLTNLW